jgi:REP element-mobilizing transposase RayT
MELDPLKCHRRSIRLPGYDYSQAGAYFVTVCTHRRRCLSGQIADGEMHLSEAGHIARAVWHELRARFPFIESDQFVVMPNHVHGIVLAVGAQFIAPTNLPTRQGAINRAPTLGEIVRVFKALTTRRIHASRVADFGWQRNYFEHVIRNERELNLIQRYIIANPMQWDLDCENPLASGMWHGPLAHDHGRDARATWLSSLCHRPVSGHRHGVAHADHIERIFGGARP